MKPLADLKDQADTIEQQRTFMRFAWACGKGVLAWVTCQGIEPWERVTPDLFRAILARILGSHDRDVVFGTLCHEGVWHSTLSESLLDLLPWRDAYP